MQSLFVLFVLASPFRRFIPIHLKLPGVFVGLVAFIFVMALLLIVILMLVVGSGDADASTNSCKSDGG